MLSAVAALAAGRGRVDTAYQHNPSARFTVAPHAHADLLQLDLIDGCTGECHTGGAWRGIAGLTALLSRPDETHGYALDPLPGASPNKPGAAVVHHLKLRITDISAWPLFDGGFLRPCAPRIDAARDLLTPFRRLTRGGGAPPDPAEEVALLAEILALWPRRGAPDAAAPRDRGEANLEALDPKLTPALRILHEAPQPMAPPPPLEHARRRLPPLHPPLLPPLHRADRLHPPRLRRRPPPRRRPRPAPRPGPPRLRGRRQARLQRPRRVHAVVFEWSGDAAEAVSGGSFVPLTREAE